MKKLIFSLIALILLVTSIMLTGCNNRSVSNSGKEDVTIIDKSTHYEVVLDFNNSKSHKEIGEEYATKILHLVPNFESLIDSYLLESIGSQNDYKVVLKRVDDIKPQIDKQYRDEIEGMASKLSGSNQNIIGDGKISIDELYMINLFTDVVRGTQCSALGVYGQRSETKDTIAARILDWNSGSKNQLAQIQAVTTFKNSNKSICTIGFLGYIGVVSGFNDNKVFAAILDSSTGEMYSSESKRSYPLDLRHALENYNTLDDVGNYLKSSKRSYSFSHLIFLCDSNISKVLENNISSGAHSIRELRTENSKINAGVHWDIDNSIGCVNSFLLKGNFDSYNIESNFTRWDSMKKQLKAKGSAVTFDQLKQIACYYTGSNPGLQNQGDLYNLGTNQIIIFEPSKLNLQVFFKPKDGNLPKIPTFDKVSIIF